MGSAASANELGPTVLLEVRFHLSRMRAHVNIYCVTGVTLIHFIREVFTFVKLSRVLDRSRLRVIFVMLLLIDLSSTHYIDDHTFLMLFLLIVL